jgi:MFS family permease
MYKGLPRNIYYIALARFILGLGNFIIPFLLLFFTEKIGCSVARAGVLAMVIMLLYLLGNLVGGKMSDTIGHKSVMVSGELIGSILLILVGFYSYDPFIAPILMYAGYFFFGLALPAANALVADLSNPENRDAIMSLGYLAFNLGSGFGPIIAGYLFWEHTEWIFWGNGIAGMVGILIVFFNVDNQSIKKNDIKFNHSALEDSVAGPVSEIFKQRPQILIFGFLCTALWFCLNQMTMTSPLFFSRVYGMHGPVLFGQLMTFSSFFIFIITPFLMKSFRGVNEIKCVFFSGLFFSIGYYLVFENISIIMLFFAWSFLSAGEVLLLTKEGIYLANQSPKSHRGRINGILGTMRNLILMPTYMLMGVVINDFGYNITWGIIISVALISSLLLLFLSAKNIDNIRY